MTTEHEISKLVGFIELGIDFWEKAGVELVRLKKSDPDVFDVITREHHWLSRDILIVLEQVGLKKIHPLALLAPNHVFEKLAQMPYEQQRYICANPVVEVAEAPGVQGHHKLFTLSRATADLALAKDGVRSLIEQHKLIAAKPTQPPLPKPIGVYQITVMNRKVFVRETNRSGAGIPQKVQLNKAGIAIVELFP